MSEIKKIEDGKLEITCNVEGEEWKKATDKAFKKICNKLQIKGFRKGQVPASLAKKYVSDKEVQLDAANDICNSVFENALKEHDVELIDKANLDIKEIDENHVLLVFTCPVKPDVILGDYKAIKYELEEVNVTDEDVKAEINKTLDRKADLELKEDGEVENGDTAVIDFEGYKDGVLFDGGKADNYDLVIGSNSFIPGFEEQLIGMKSEEEKDINVTFPEDYHVEELKGQPVVFKVKVHEIKKKVVPELDDEFVKELKIENVNTAEEYRNYLKDSLTNIRKREAEEKADEKLIKDLSAICEVNIPEVMINTEIDALMQEQAQRLMYQGISFDQYKQIINQNDEQIRLALKPSASERVKASLCLEALAKAENVEINKEDIDAQYEELTNLYGIELAEIKKYIGESDIKNDIRVKKALEILKANK